MIDTAEPVSISIVSGFPLTVSTVVSGARETPDDCCWMANNPYSADSDISVVGGVSDVISCMGRAGVGFRVLLLPLRQTDAKCPFLRHVEYCESLNQQSGALWLALPHR